MTCLVAMPQAQAMVDLLSFENIQYSSITQLVVYLELDVKEEQF